MKILSNKPTITRKELEGVLDCMIKDEFTAGNSVKNFEASLASMIGLKYPLAVSSLTAAYHLIFCALDLQGGDEVIVPSYFDPAPLAAAKLAGVKIVPVDSEENSIFPSIENIKSAINENTKAVIIGHTFGFHFDEPEIYELKIPVIEDISHSLGTELHDVQSGQRAAFAVASFSPAMIITTGRGAAVLTNNSKHFSVMRDLRGLNDDSLNYDYGMTDLEGAMGITQLVKMKDFLKRRREIAKIYCDAVKITPHKTLYPFSDKFAYQTFPVIFDSTSEKTDKFWKRSAVELLNPIPKPIHAFMGFRGLDYPNSDRMAKKLFALPLYPTLSKKDIERISRTLSAFI